MLESHFLTKDREGATTPRRKREEPQEFNVRLKLTGEMARRFNAVKRKHQFRQNTDRVRMLINEEYEKIARFQPLLQHFNTYEDHITIRDNQLGRYIDIWPKNGKLWCEYCEKNPMSPHHLHNNRSRHNGNLGKEGLETRLKSRSPLLQKNLLLLYSTE